MCPLYPLHYVFTLGTLLLTVWPFIIPIITAEVQNKLQIALNNSILTDLLEGETKKVTFFLKDLPVEAVGNLVIREESADGMSHMSLSPSKIPMNVNSSSDQYVNVTGIFLGFSKIKFILSSEKDDAEMMESKPQPVKVHRETQTLDIVFVHVIVLLVIVAFVNMGCAIDLQIIKDNLKRPVAPVIGLCSQYFFMPVVSYFLGYLLFSGNPELWLGLFLTGCAPGGGGSNMWTYLLGGSLDLSITMTLLSTLMAFAALPLWVLALGPSIFPEGDYGRLPYRNIAALIVGLILPIGIGLLIRRCCPKAADFLKKMLKPVSIFFIVFIITFGIYAKFYIFAFFTWKVALGGFLLPFGGFAFGALVARLTGRKSEDVIAISIETGIQNTGLSIGVLKVALAEFDPLGDISIVVPVAVATMTPLPLLILLILRKFRARKNKNSTLELVGESVKDFDAIPKDSA